MKKYLLLMPLFFVFAIVLSSCGEDSTSPDPVNETGSLSISTTPVDSAEIWINGTNTGRLTPATISDLEVGQVTITLSRGDGYRDTTFTSNVIADQTTPINVELTSTYLTFNNLRIYETVGTTANQPSGIDLSSGSAIGIGSASADRGNVDIYYTSTGFVITSADNATGLTRKTYFKVGSATDLNDGTDSPVQDNTWTDRITDRETNYVFLKDADGHYSKIKITSFGGGTPGQPAWVEVSGIYNQGKGSTKF